MYFSHRVVPPDVREYLCQHVAPRAIIMFWQCKTWSWVKRLVLAMCLQVSDAKKFVHFSVTNPSETSESDFNTTARERIIKDLCIR